MTLVDCDCRSVACACHCHFVADEIVFALNEIACEFHNRRTVYHFFAHCVAVRAERDVYDCPEHLKFCNSACRIVVFATFACKEFVGERNDHSVLARIDDFVCGNRNVFAVFEHLIGQREVRVLDKVVPVCKVVVADSVFAACGCVLVLCAVVVFADVLSTKSDVRLVDDDALLHRTAVPLDIVAVCVYIFARDELTVCVDITSDFDDTAIRTDVYRIEFVALVVHKYNFVGFEFALNDFVQTIDAVARLVDCVRIAKLVLSVATHAHAGEFGKYDIERCRVEFRICAGDIEYRSDLSVVIS